MFASTGALVSRSATRTTGFEESGPGDEPAATGAVIVAMNAGSGADEIPVSVVVCGAVSGERRGFLGWCERQAP